MREASRRGFGACAYAARMRVSSKCKEGEGLHSWEGPAGVQRLVTTLTNNGGMDAAKDLLKRAVELDSAQRYSEAIICYEEGIQNILRAIGGILLPNLDHSVNIIPTCLYL